MSTLARKRLMRDFKRLKQDPPAGISSAPYDNNIMLWNAVIFSPDDIPWDGGTFKLTLQFSGDYPNKPPTVRFISRMFHPNMLIFSHWVPLRQRSGTYLPLRVYLLPVFVAGVQRTAADFILQELQKNPDTWLQEVHSLSNTLNLNNCLCFAGHKRHTDMNGVAYSELC